VTRVFGLPHHPPDSVRLDVDAPLEPRPQRSPDRGLAAPRDSAEEDEAAAACLSHSGAGLPDLRKTLAQPKGETDLPLSLGVYPRLTTKTKQAAMKTTRDAITKVLMSL